MPYIKPELRKLVDEPLMNLIERVAWSLPLMDDDQKAGTLNYLITKLILALYPKELSRYRHHNEVIGVLESAKQEYYRRLVAPYEDKKIEESGDVY